MEKFKDLFYEQIARIGKVFSNPKRLELLDLLCQGEKSVDVVAKQAHISIKLASFHLQELKDSTLIEARKEGKYVFYKVTDETVALFYSELKLLAERKLISNQKTLSNYLNSNENVLPVDKKTLIRKARKGEIIVIDLRPRNEYISGHIPFARSIPINELEKKLKGLPKDKDIVAYCRGPACVWSHEALVMLKSNGYNAFRLRDSIIDWQAEGLPVKR